MAPINEIGGGYLKKWLVLGPFFPDDLQKDFLTGVGGEANIQPEAGHEVAIGYQDKLVWKEYDSGLDDIIDLCAAVGPAERATAYAFCLLRSQIARDVKISLGSDDGVAVWINGAEVHRNPSYRAFKRDEDIFDVKLRAGLNRCLVKVSQGKWDWKFALKPEVIDISGVLVYDTGSVVPGQQGKTPLSGVDVKLSTSQTARTNVNGKFIFTGVSANDLSVNLQKELDLGGLPKLRLSDASLASIKVRRKTGQPVDLGEIVYEASGGFVRGIIFLDEDGKGEPGNNPRLARVPVSLHNLSTNTITKAETDAQGAYYFDNPEPAVYTLKFERTLDAVKHGVGEGKLTLPDSLPEPFFLGPDEEKTEDLGYLSMGGTVHGIAFLDKDANRRRFGNEPGIPGVPVILVDARGRVAGHSETTHNGEYSINVPAGTYTLKFNDVLVLSSPETDVATFRAQYGDEFTLTAEEPQQVIVKPGETSEAAPTGYAPETHEIRGRVIFDNGTPVANLVVTLADAAGNEIDTVMTDDEGKYVFTGRQGDFTLQFPESLADGQLLSPKTKHAHVTSIFRVADTVYRSAVDSGGGGPIVTPTGGTLQDAVSDIASYMPTAQEVISPMPRGGTWGTPGAPASLQQVVDGVLTEVLGRKRTDEPKAFLASLERSFALEQFEGHTRFKWTPRTYAVQTELGGGLTGAQASIYHRAKVALDDALPLLDGLYPLLPNFDQQEVDAARSIVRTEFIELVNEVGVEGGPRPQRVDDIFDLLRKRLDGDPPIKSIRVVFGLTPSNVITVEEEQNLTNFFVIRDYVEGLFTTWNRFKGQFTTTDTSPKALGTQLVLLSRALSVVAESVDETNLVMDSVFLGPNERQTVLITFPRQVQIEGRLVPTLSDTPGQQPPSMVVDELMSWVGRFAKDEAPQLIQEGGKRGVEAILPIAERLERLVIGAAQPGASTHIGFSRQRVRRSLIELANQLGQVRRFASELLRNGNLNA